MITLNDQDLEALLKMSNKELVKLAVAPTAAIRLRRDAAHLQHLPGCRGQENYSVPGIDFPLETSPITVVDGRDLTGPRRPRETLRPSLRWPNRDHCSSRESATCCGEKQNTPTRRRRRFCLGIAFAVSAAEISPPNNDDPGKPASQQSVMDTKILDGHVGFYQLNEMASN